MATSSTPLVMMPLCEARLQLDARFPWIVLIPRRDGALELENLAGVDQALLMMEIVQAGAAVRSIGVALSRPVEKLNIGALGNIVPQLHVHVVGRRADDAAWPGPVWGVGEAVPYCSANLDHAIDAGRQAFKPISG